MKTLKERVAQAGRDWLEDSHYIRHYLAPYRTYAILGVLTLACVDLLELAPPLVLKGAIDAVIEARPLKKLMIFAFLYLAILGIQGICRYGWRVLLIRTSNWAGRDIRRDFGQQLFRLSANFYDKNRVGDLISLANSDVEAIRQCIGPGLLTFADSMFYLATVPIAMFLLSPKLALVAFIPLPIIPWLVFKNESKIHSRFKKSQEQFSVLSAMAQENLSGIRVTKAFAKEDVQLGRFKKLGEDYILLNLELARVTSSFGPLLDFFMSLGIVLLLLVGGKIAIASAVTIGTFVAFQRYIQKLVWPMVALGLAISHYQRAVASSDRIEDVLKLEPTILPPPTPHPLIPIGSARVPGKIEVRNLICGFPGGDRDVLNGISLVVESGERVAFVGGVGSGKSALLGLIPRLYPAPTGSIFIDGADVNEWPLGELRRHIGYVAQDVFLFSESVFDNIGFGLQGLAEDELRERVLRAASAASVRDDIEAFPKGFETQLGERGMNLSGGQKQRLTLARAIAKDPSILILDDALSAVDVRTEDAILSGLRARKVSSTELVAAHRISTVKNSHRIVVMEQGKIESIGTHDELIRRRRGIYWHFYEQQRLREDLEQYLSTLDTALNTPLDNKVDRP